MSTKNLAGKTRRWFFHLLLMAGLSCAGFSWVIFVSGTVNTFTKTLGLLFALFWGVLYLYLAWNKVVTIPGDKHAAVQAMIFGKILNGKTESGHSLFKFLNPGWAILFPWENLFGDPVDVNRGFIEKFKYQGECADGPLDIKMVYTFRVIPSELQRVIEISEIEAERENFIKQKFTSLVSSFIRETIPQYSISELLKNKWDDKRTSEELNLSENPKAEIEKKWKAFFQGKSDEEKEVGHQISSIIIEDINLEEATQKAMEQIRVNKHYADAANELIKELGLLKTVKELRESNDSKEKEQALNLIRDSLQAVMINAGKVNKIVIEGESGSALIAGLLKNMSQKPSGGGINEKND